MNRLFQKFGELVTQLADAEECDAYALIAVTGVLQLTRIADALGKRETAIAEALAMIARAGDEQGKALEKLTAELGRHREVVDDLIGELQAMQGPPGGDAG